MATKKSISDISKQLERIRINMIRNAGGPENVSRTNVARFKKANRAARKYRENIAKHLDLTLQQAASEDLFATKNENRRLFGEEPFSAENPSKKVSRRIYMGLNML